MQLFLKKKIWLIFIAQILEKKLILVTFFATFGCNQLHLVAHSILKKNIFLNMYFLTKKCILTKNKKIQFFLKPPRIF